MYEPKWKPVWDNTDATGKVFVALDILETVHKTGVPLPYDIDPLIIREGLRRQFKIIKHPENILVPEKYLTTGVDRTLYVNGFILAAKDIIHRFLFQAHEVLHDSALWASLPEQLVESPEAGLIGNKHSARHLLRNILDSTRQK